jgi:dipeptidyl aminopeptidase/acylaminoacyl peptidase
MTLQIVPERGLWQIETITLGDRLAAAPTPPFLRSRPVAGVPRRQGHAAQGLTGRLAFQVSSGGDIYTINADGSGLRRLTDGLDPAWSPDGAQIAFSRWRSPWGIYLIQPDGSGEQRAVDGDLLKEPAWSSDGSRMAFSVNYGPGGGGGGEVCFFGYCFTPPPISVGQIWIANLDSGQFLSLPLNDKAPHSPAWDPARDRIVYAGDRGLAWIELGEGMPTGRFPEEGSSAWDGSPSFSPDGSRIAFMGRVHNRWEIFVMNAEGSGRARLTQAAPDLDQPPNNVAPTWSPDGKNIAFLSNRDGVWRIYVMNADGTGQRPMFGDQLDRLGIRYEWASERVISWTE